jgi:hypothetical protein
MDASRYQIFDSLDRACSATTKHDDELFYQLERLEIQSETTGDRLTYAIGKIFPDGTVTFDF